MAKYNYGPWEVVETLGQGGQAQVFLVRNRNDSGAPHAVLKRLNPSRLERGRAELDAAKSLHHPNIVRFVDADLDSPTPYIVFDYYSNGALSKFPISDWELMRKLRFFRSIVLGVEAAHLSGIIHRDLKPANIFVASDGETPVVGDFGICFVNRAGERVTLMDEAVGPRRFTAPELEDGRGLVTAAADVYSLGKLLYWMIMGRVFDRERHKEPAWALVSPLTDLAPHIAAQYELVIDILDRCIVEDRGQRFNDGKHLRANLDRTIWRLERNLHSPRRSARKICNFCGLGQYEILYDGADPRADQIEASKIGLSTLVGVQWLVLICNHCAHIEHFRLDHAKVGAWDL